MVEAAALAPAVAMREPTAMLFPVRLHPGSALMMSLVHLEQSVETPS